MRTWLKQIREAVGLSQAQAAAAAGISQQMYSCIENGTRCRPDKVITEKKIAGALGFCWTKFFMDDE